MLSNFGPGFATVTRDFFFGCTQSLEVNTGILPYKITHVYCQPSPMNFLILKTRFNVLYAAYATDKIAVIRNDQLLIPYSQR